MEQAVGIAGVENDRLDDEERLDALGRALMYGFVDVLLVRLKNNKDALARSRFPDLRKKFAEIKTAAEEAAATEGIHGRGALLNLDHPFVQKMSKGTYLGRPKIDPSELACASRYRDFIAGGC